ncbi:MAG: phosphoglycerate kinase [Clostridia bacterium]|nr:phosphoglycerate kinase [Clostridia bacterium]
MNKKTVKDIDVKGKKVLMRVDFNVPMDGERITDENRINGALPTIKYLIENGAALILCSHMGKPHNVFNSTLKLNKKEKAKIEALPEEERAAATEKALEKAKGDVKKFSLAPVAKRLSELLGQEVIMAEDVIGPDAQAKAAALQPGQVMVLQNLRFHAEEEKNDPEFAKALASLADTYVNDAFGTAHRAHASTEGVTHYLPAACGFLIEKELRIMGKALENADRPFVAVLGGAKIEDKLNVINNLLEKVDTLIIGGGMAFTFLKAKGYEVGESLLDESKIDYCKDMMKKAEEKGVKLLLPVDTVCVKEFPNPIDAPVETLVCDADKIPDDMEGCDIGPKTAELFAEAVKAAKTVVWNGPMGVFENPTLAKGTLGVAQAMADSDAVTIIGGGDSAAAVQQMGLASKMTHISTGGGASLEYLEGKTLPGVAALNDK